MIRAAVIVADAKVQRIVLWNSAATGIFGCSPSEALNGNAHRGFGARALQGPASGGDGLLPRDGQGPLINTNRLLGLAAVAKTGKKIRVESSLSPIAPEHDRAGPYMLAIMHDITERNRAEKFAAQLLRHLSGELVSKPDITLLPDVVLKPRVPLQEAQEVKLTACELEALRLLALGKIILRCVNTGGKR